MGSNPDSDRSANLSNLTEIKAVTSKAEKLKIRKLTTALAWIAELISVFKLSLSPQGDRKLELENLSVF